MEYRKLNNGIDMPALGFGVYKIPDHAECERAVAAALSEGYRLIDTAAAYMNEEAVGRAVARSGVPRDEVFLTSKVWVQDFGYERTLAAFDDMMARLDTDYLDLLLLHHMIGDYYGSWRALQELLGAGRVHSIGVCNFSAGRLVDLILNNEVAPAVNQIECHPFFQREVDLAEMRKLGVQPEAWGPLAQGARGVFQNEALRQVGETHGKSAGQVVLRWHVQRGVIPIPKSTHVERMRENLDVFDFELSADEMARIAALDEGETIYHLDDEPDYVRATCAHRIR